MLYQLNYWRVMTLRLTGLFVNSVLAAPGAILLELHTIRSIALVLVGGVIATLALGACEGNHCTHESSCTQSPQHQIIEGNARGYFTRT